MCQNNVFQIFGQAFISKDKLLWNLLNFIFLGTKQNKASSLLIISAYISHLTNQTKNKNYNKSEIGFKLFIFTKITIKERKKSKTNNLKSVSNCSFLQKQTRIYIYLWYVGQPNPSSAVCHGCNVANILTPPNEVVRLCRAIQYPTMASLS